MTDKKNLNLLTDIPSPYVVNANQTSDDTKKVFTAFRDAELSAYLDRTPYARNAMELLTKEGGVIVNDHVALRCFKDAKGVGGCSVLEKLFLAFGYKRENNITVEPLFLDCYWYEPPEDTSWPKVFISEQQVEHLPIKAQDLVYHTIGDAYRRGALVDIALDSPEQVDPQHLFELLDTVPWSLSSGVYKELLELAEQHEKEHDALQYAAWTLVNGHRWNHLTILMNMLEIDRISNLEDLNAFLKDHNFPLNELGGKEIQGSKEQHLKQSSTVANMITHRFSDGVELEVRGAFVEFIERFFVDEKPYRGFIAGSARGIFRSTNR